MRGTPGQISLSRPLPSLSTNSNHAREERHGQQILGASLLSQQQLPSATLHAVLLKDVRFLFLQRRPGTVVLRRSRHSKCRFAALSATFRPNDRPLSSKYQRIILGKPSITFQRETTYVDHRFSAQNFPCRTGIAAIVRGDQSERRHCLGFWRYVRFHQRKCLRQPRHKRCIVPKWLFRISSLRDAERRLVDEIGRAHV